MAGFTFKELNISGVYVVTSSFSDDLRGILVKNFERDSFKETGLDFSCSETFISTSAKNVIRGLHFQTHAPQTKIVGVISGKVFDVVVDLRKDSPTYMKWEGLYLSRENRNSLIIPRGCAHGFLSLSEDSLVSYLCDGEYDKDTDTGIFFNDPDIGIEWPIMDISSAVVSKRDMGLMSFKVFDGKNPFTMGNCS